MARSERVSLPTVINCDDCCACCMHMDYPAFLQGSDTQPAEEHWTNLPEALKEELLTYVAEYQEPAKGELGRPCVWLDLQTRRCKHHPHRPKVCRDFKTGCADCRGWRREYFVGKR